MGIVGGGLGTSSFEIFGVELLAEIHQNLKYNDKLRLKRNEILINHKE
jgi:hypothetical protein